MSKLLNVFQLSEENGLSVRTLRGFVQAKKIPYLKIGRRTILFDPAKVTKALNRFEVQPIVAKGTRAKGGEL